MGTVQSRRGICAWSVLAVDDRAPEVALADDAGHRLSPSISCLCRASAPAGSAQPAGDVAARRCRLHPRRGPLTRAARKPRRPMVNRGAFAYGAALSSPIVSP